MIVTVYTPELNVFNRYTGVHNVDTFVKCLMRMLKANELYDFTIQIKEG